MQIEGESVEIRHTPKTPLEPYRGREREGKKVVEQVHIALDLVNTLRSSSSGHTYHLPTTLIKMYTFYS